MYYKIMLDPTRHFSTNPEPQFVYGEGPSKMWFENVLIQFIVLNKDINKDRHTAKSKNSFGFEKKKQRWRAHNMYHWLPAINNVLGIGRKNFRKEINWVSAKKSQSSRFIKLFFVSGFLPSFRACKKSERKRFDRRNKK